MRDQIDSDGTVGLVVQINVKIIAATAVVPEPVIEFDLQSCGSGRERIGDQSVVFISTVGIPAIGPDAAAIRASSVPGAMRRISQCPGRAGTAPVVDLPQV